jgi:gluconate 2-dehydrogenase gamma chain
MSAPPRSHLDDHAWRTIEAAMARIVPSDDTPGAREAGAIRFLDLYLGGEAIYATADGTGFRPLSGRRAEAWRQRVRELRARYADGVAELDRRARDLRGAAFADLDEADQDRVLAALDTSAAAEPAMQRPLVEDELGFLDTLILHTRQGVYADPAYGGNLDHVGWRLLGFPGPESLAAARDGRHDTRDELEDDT